MHLSRSAPFAQDTPTRHDNQTLNQRDFRLRGRHLGFWTASGVGSFSSSSRCRQFTKESGSLRRRSCLRPLQRLLSSVIVVVLVRGTVLMVPVAPGLLVLVNHDGPFEGTGGNARNEVQHGGPDEAAGGALESARPTSDGVRFHNRGEIAE